MKIKRKTYRRSAFAFCLISSLFFLWTVTWSQGEEIQYKEIYTQKPYPEKIKSGNTEIDASAAISVFWDGNQKRILYDKNIDKQLSIASISKIFTALLVYEEYDLNAPINVTQKDIMTNPGLSDLRIWNDTKIGDTLYPLLLESNNSIANALAMQDNRFLEKGFVKEMNKKAKEIGLSNTSFINPSGLDERGGANMSTAREIYKTAKYTLENSDLFSIMNTPSYRVYSYDKSLYYVTINTNEFLFSRDKEWKNRIVGGKTGWTLSAKGCLLMVIESPQEKGYIINVVLGAEDRFQEMEKMIDYIHKSYKF